MIYSNMLPARFLRRPNRFIAHIEVDGREEICHVKNTGRCRELLLPGTPVYVQKSQNPLRKTAFDLITVQKGNRLVNIDASAPNAAFSEWVQRGGTGIENLTLRPEVKNGDSRFDFLLQTPKGRIWVEVKGVTQEKDNMVMFPDAPTQRGAKHLHGLKRLVLEGDEAWAVFVVQMQGTSYFTPNREMDPQLAQALEDAAACGVRVLALECAVTPDSMEIIGEIPVRI